MKKIYLLFLGIFVSVFTINAQTIYTTSQNYDNLKKAGKLDSRLHYELLPANANTKTPATRPSITRASTGTNPTTASNCQCLQPLDATYSIVPITSGTAPEYRNDDGSTLSIPLGFNFCFYGTTYNSVFINNNGNISFGASYATFSASGFPNANFVMVAPFWGDVDTRNLASGLPYFKKTATALIVKWDHVGYYNSYADKVNDFQLIITDGSDPILPNGNNVAFCYGDMQWTTGDASGGTNGFGGTPATVGVNKGDGFSYVQIGRFDQVGSSYDGPYGLNDGISFLDNKSYFFNTCGTNNNLPPIVQDATGGGSACGDTISICALGDTLVYTTSFLAPENNQTVSITATAPTLGGSFQPLGITNTSGGITTYAWRVVATPSVTGVHTVVITGTDNGNPPLSSSATYYIKILNVAVPHPTLSIAPATGTVCASPGATLTLVNCSAYDNVYWSNGGAGCSTIASSTGVYYVTVNKLGCFKSSSDTINVFANPIPVVSGFLNYCSPATSTTLSVNPPLPGFSAYNTFTWTPGAINTSTASLTGSTGAGVSYTVSVTDMNGCIGMTSFNVSTSSPTLAVTANPLSVCGAGTTTLNASVLAGATYTWSNGSMGPLTTVNTGGVYTVTMTSNGSCVTTQTINVNVSPTPTVVITPSVSICAGATGTVDVVSISPAGAYTYTWSTGAHTASIPVTTGGTVSLVVTNTVSGCISDTSNICTISTTSNPVPNLIISGPFNYCFPSTFTTLNILPPQQGMPAYSTYSWSPGAISTPMATLTAGTYTVIVVDVNGCSATQSFPVSNTPPTLTITANPISICGSTSSTLTPSILGASSYSWSNGATTETTTVNASGTYTLWVNANNCAVSNTISVQINPTPTISIPANLAICAGAAVTVTPVFVLPAGAYTYTWSTGAHTSSIVVSSAATVTVQVTNTASGCTAVSNPCVIVATPNPLVTFVNPVTFCEGLGATLTPTVTGGTPSYTYSWTPSFLGNGPSATTANTGTFSVLVIDQNNCRGTGTVTTVKSNPSVVLGSPDLIICPNECSVITATATSPYQPFTYSWSNNPADTDDSVLVCTAGQVVVRATDAKGCVTSNTITVVNDVSPVASFTATPSSPVAPGQNINFTSTSTMPTGTITTTTWVFGDGNGGSGTPITHAYEETGTYTITLTVTGSAGCIDTMAFVYHVEGQLNIPNIITPNGDGVNDYLKFKGLESLGNNSISIFNRWGKKLFEQDNYKNDWNGAGYTDGTYFFILTVPEATPTTYKGHFQIMR
jgi:gliding motility-associated-like protein